jgi:hypothetical protein
MATKQAASRAAGLKGDFGTLRDTFFEQSKQSIGLQGSMLDIGDENRRAVDAMHRKTQKDALIHKSKMAQLNFDFRRKQMEDQFADSAVGQTIGIMDQVISQQRNRRQLEEMRKAMGLGISGLDPNMQSAIPGLVQEGLHSNYSQSTYDLPNVGGLA